MRIGIFGGTFDPVHLGHLIVAEQAREQAGLDQVWFVPSARPPHKLEKPITAFDRRVEMIQLAITGQPDFQVETVEKDRPGPSFTVDTLADLIKNHPGNEYCLILGVDCLPEFHTWREPLRILEMAKLLVAARPGWSFWTAQELAHSLHLPDATAVRMRSIQAPMIEISSRELRRKAAQAHSLRYMVPRAVEVYIREKRIYTSAP